jgi:hypothetical protein
MSIPPDRNEFEGDDPRDQQDEDPLDFLRASLFGEGDEDTEGEPPPAGEDTPDSDAGGDEPAPSDLPKLDDFPDWLTDAVSEETPETAASPAQSDELPDWMAGFEPSEEPSPPSAPEAPPAQSDELPDWMAGFDPSAATPEPPALTPIEGQDDDLPDWLQGAESPPEKSETPAQPTTFGPRGGEMPDWLQAAQPAPSSPEPSGDVEVPDWLGAAAAPSQPTSSPQDDAIPEWLGGSAASPPATPASSAAGEGTPDWLSATEPAPAQPEAPTQPEAPAPAGDDVPDWLKDAEEVQTSAPSQPAAGDLPDWRADAGLGEAPEEPSPAEPAAAGDLPDWMADAGLGEAPETLSPAEPAAAAGDLPDWMAEAGLGEAPEEPSPAEPAAAAGDLPDWMADIEAPASEKPSVEPSAPAEPLAPAEPTAAPSGDVPDWMADFEAPAAAPDEPEAESDLKEEGLPDWIQSFQAPEPEPEPPPGVLATLQFDEQEEHEPAEPPADEPTPVSEAAEETPPWLEGIVPDTSDEPASPPEKLTPPAEQPDEDWIASLALGTLEQAPPAEPSDDLLTPPAEKPAPAAPEAEMPAEPLPAAEAAPAPSAGEDDDLMSLFEGFDLETVDTGEPMPAEEDPTGLDAIFAEGMKPASPEPEEEAEEEEGEAVKTGDLPEWLRKVPGSEPSGLEAERPQEETLSADEIGQLADLRFDAIVEDVTSRTERPEPISALKDVTGMLRPELLFEGESLAADERVDEIVITKEQANRIGFLEVMLAEEAVEEPIASRARPSTPLVSWATTIAMLAAILLPVVLGINILPGPVPGPGPIAAQAQIEALPSGARVIAAFEYEPDTAAEMDPLAVALLEHLAEREATVYAISTRPTGPAMADRAAQGAAYPAANLVNLGYVSGKVNGIREIAVGSTSPLSSPLAFDSLGQATNLGARRLQDIQPDLVIVLTSHPEEARAWVEQAASRIDAPMLAATSLSAGPLVYPYVQSGQLVAVMSGLNDAVAYRTLISRAPGDTLVSTWNAQATSGLVAALAIVVGMLAYGLRELRLQQERES